MQVKDKIIDIPPLNTMLKFVEFAIFHGFDLQQWDQHFTFSPGNGARQFRAAKWTSLIEGEIRYPGTWKAGRNLTILRKDGVYSIGKLLEIVSSHSLFQIALMDLQNEIEPPQIRKRLKQKILADFSKDDGSEYSSATATLRSSQVITWSRMILGELEINLSGVGYLLSTQQKSVSQIDLHLRRPD